MKNPNEPNTEDVIKKKKKINKKMLIIGLVLIFVTIMLANIVNKGNNTQTTNKVNTAQTTEKINNDDATQVEDNIADEFKYALRKAEMYSDLLNMSKQAIYDQLISETEQFSNEASQYAIDNLSVDYKENALKKAESYKYTMNMSKQAIYEQLTSEYGEKFTTEEAEYAINNLDKVGESDPNISIEFKNALSQAEYYGNKNHMSKKAIYEQLTSEYGGKFSLEAAQYAVDNLETDYFKNALHQAEYYYNKGNMSEKEVYDQLTSEYGGQFTAEEAQYAVDNLKE